MRKSPRSNDTVRRLALFNDQDGLCFYCLLPMALPPHARVRPPRAATIDHLVPRSEGGRRRFPNEVAACNACNNERGTTPWLLFYCLKEIERGSSRQASLSMSTTTRMRCPLGAIASQPDELKPPW